MIGCVSVIIYDVTLAQLAMQPRRLRTHEMKHDPRVAPGELIDDGEATVVARRGSVPIRTSPAARNRQETRCSL
jgi:hypothetical protein